MKQQYSESDLARLVVAWLQDQMWTVYQEVQIKSGGCRADIVATQGNVLWVVETKRQFGIAVIEQAEYWQRYAHYCSVATTRAGRHSRIFDEYIRWKGIGNISVAHGDYSTVYENLKPRLNRKADAKRMRSLLHEEQKTWAPAGNAAGLRYSPFQGTCKRVLEAVRTNPGIGMKELLQGIDTHYASLGTARSCLARWAEAGAIKGVRVERDGKRIRLYPIEDVHAV